MPIFASNFTSNSLSGAVFVSGGNVAVTLTPTPFALEGDKSFVIKIRRGSTQGTVLSTSAPITLKDRSSFVSLTANTATVNEGDLVAFTLVTANAAGNSTLFYSVLGQSYAAANVNSSDFVANTGSFSLINNVGTFALKANADLSLMGEYNEEFSVQLRAGSTTGNIVYTTSSIAIKDTSNAYNVLSFVENSASAIIEGSNVTFTLTAVNIVDSQPGVILYYNTTGNVTSFTSNIGSFVMTGVNAEGISNTFVITNPQVPFGATRSFNVVVRRDSASGPIIATSNTINVFDASLVSMSASGGVQSNISGYRIHTFTTSGGITFSKSGGVDYLIVAGGGGGAPAASGGGGGGLLLSGSNDATPFTATGGTPYSIVIGAGGSTSTQGTPSTGFGLIAYGGGGGGPAPSGVGTNGGSGGGGAFGGAGKGVYLGSPYISSPRQGYDGGPSNPSTGRGGGGGAGGAGVLADFNDGGGAGLNLSFTGSPYTYSAGGPGTSGSSYYTGPGGTNYTNTGTYGAGGTGAYSNPGGGFSGPGFVAVKYWAGAPVFTNISAASNSSADIYETFTYEGGNVAFLLNTNGIQNNTLFYYSTVGNADASFFVSSNVGSFRTTNDSTTIVSLQTNTNIPTNEERSFQIKIAGESGSSAAALFTSNLYTIKDNNLRPKVTSVEYLIVAGGGGGSKMGGAGGGGILSNIAIITPGTTYNIVVGAGGVGDYSAVNGSNSTVFSLTASGGGAGNNGNGVNPGGAGGGGDGPGPGSSYGLGTAGQGNPGSGAAPTPSYPPGGTGNNLAGGGGAGSGAGAPGGTSAGGAGGTYSISGSSTIYAGGGGGAKSNGGSPGGAGGGGYGNQNSGGNGTVNTGGGGGSGYGYTSGTGGTGGSGIVIVRYPDTFATVNTTGSPNIIYANANVIYRFTQSGSITFP